MFPSFRLILNLAILGFRKDEGLCGIDTRDYPSVLGNKSSRTFERQSSNVSRAAASVFAHKDTVCVNFRGMFFVAPLRNRRSHMVAICARYPRIFKCVLRRSVRVNIPRRANGGKQLVLTISTERVVFAAPLIMSRIIARLFTVQLPSIDRLKPVPFPFFPIRFSIYIYLYIRTMTRTVPRLFAFTHQLKNTIIRGKLHLYPRI